MQDVHEWLQVFRSWDPTTQNHARNQLLKLTSNHAMHQSSRLYHGRRKDFLSALPEVLAMAVLGLLSAKDLGHSGIVCSHWYDRCSCDGAEFLWERAYRDQWPSCTLLEDDSKLVAVSWYQEWRTRFINKSMWISNHVRHVEFKGHRDRVRHVRIRGQWFISASWDGTLRAGRSDNLQGESTELTGHAGSVFGACFNGEIAGTCSEDCTIRVWQVAKGKCAAALSGHNGAVYRAELIEPDVLVSCSNDFIGVWNWRSNTLLHRLTGHTHDVHRLQARRPYIVTGSYDKSVRVWDYPSCRFKWSSPACHEGGVSCLHFSGNLLVTGSAKGQVFVWDLQTGKLKFELGKPHNGALVTCVWVEGAYIMSASIVSLSSLGGTTCLWSTVDGRCIEVINEASYINAWRNEVGLLYCAYSDGHLRIRDTSNKLALVREFKHGNGPLYDVDVQNEYAITCGLDQRVVVWRVGK